MIFAYIKSFFFNLLGIDSYEEQEKETLSTQYAEECLKLEFGIQTENENTSIFRKILRQNCFKRTGIITYINEDRNYVYIDGMLYYNTTGCSVKFKLNERVMYLYYKHSNDCLIVQRIQKIDGKNQICLELYVDGIGLMAEMLYVIRGEVEFLTDRMVIMKNSSLKFSLDKVTGIFVPMQGDLLKLTCKVKNDENYPADIALNYVKKVLWFRPLKRKFLSTIITKWNGEEGICDDQIFLNKHCIINGGQIQVGAKALIEAVKSNQGSCSWRVITIQITEKSTTQESIPE